MKSYVRFKGYEWRKTLDKYEVEDFFAVEGEKVNGCKFLLVCENEEWKHKWMEEDNKVNY